MPESNVQKPSISAPRVRALLRELREYQTRLEHAERERKLLATQLDQATKAAARLEKRAALTEERLRAALEEISALKMATKGAAETARMELGRTPEGEAGALPESESSTNRAAETSRAKSALLANLTQSLQGPVEHIVQAVQELLALGVKDDGQEAIETLLNAADVLARACEDVVGFAQLEPPEMELCRRPLDLRASVEEVGRLVAHRAQHKGLEVVVDADPSLVRLRLGDAVRLRQVLLNLANNAVQFTRCGRVELRVAPTEGELARFAVVDTGCGMGATMVDQLMYGDEEVVSRDKTAPGLGMAVSRQIVRQMGGTLRIESELGRGTEVSFVAPFPYADAAPQADRAVDSPTFDLHGAIFLVAEPHARTRAMLCHQITAWGGTARPIIRADRTLARLREARVAGRPVAAAIFGFVEDNTGALRLKEAVRRDPDVRDTHLILLAPIAHLGQHGHEGGFEAVLAKPLRQSELKRALAAAAGNGCEVPAAEEQPADGAGQRPGSGQVLVVVEAAGAQKAIRDYLHSHNLRALVVDSGPKALAEVERNDFDLILIDCELSGMDGFAISTAIRAMEEQGVVRHPAPIIGIVPNESRDAEERCRLGGIDGCLPRPVHRESLDRYLKAFLAT